MVRTVDVYCFAGKLFSFFSITWASVGEFLTCVHIPVCMYIDITSETRASTHCPLAVVMFVKEEVCGKWRESSLGGKVAMLLLSQVL